MHRHPPRPYRSLAGWVAIGMVFGLSIATSQGCKERSRNSTGPEANRTASGGQAGEGKPGGGSQAGLESLQQSLALQSRTVSAVDSAVFHNGREGGTHSILEIVGGGVSCLDLDRDGLVDLAFATGGGITPEQVTGRTPVILRGLGNWAFMQCEHLARCGDDSLYSHGWSVCDVDHDGFDDLLLYGFPGASLWFNQGDGTFARSLFSHDQWTTAVAWLDANRDGHLDLYAGSYVQWDPSTNQVCNTKAGLPDVCSPNVYQGVQNQCWLNQGNGSFVSDDGVLATSSPAKSLGALAAEFQPGRGTGLYVANDLLANFYFAPQSSGLFEEQAFTQGVALDDTGVANGSMGLALLDGNLDQSFDIFVANFEHELLGMYVGTPGGDLFVHASRRMGLNRPDLKIVAFGVVAADLDGDADEDLIVVGGHVHYYPDHGEMEQSAFCLLNDSGQRFVKADSSDPFFAEPMVGRGLVSTDLDRDGDLDLIATQLSGVPRVVENTSVGDSHWLTLELIGTRSPRFPVGTTVELNAGDGKLKQVRQLVSGGSYLSHNQSILHFAWPREVGRQYQLQVRWPDGAPSEMIFGVLPDQSLTLIQGQE